MQIALSINGGPRQTWDVADQYDPITGIVGDGLTDDTAAIQAALDAAPFGGAVRLPPRPCRITGPLRITKPMTFCGSGFGSGAGSVLLIDPAVDVYTDILRCVPGGHYEFLTLRDFGILPASGAPGRHGIVFDSGPAAGWSKVTIQRVFIRAPNGRAIKVNNPPPFDGGGHAFFCSQILDCQLEGGIYLLGAGDSVTIQRNVITTSANATTEGQGPGVEAHIVHTNDGVGTSRLLTIAFNNITTVGGALWLGSGEQTKVLYNNIELPPRLSTQRHQAMIDLDGSPYHILGACEVRGNYIGCPFGYASYGVRVNYARNTVIEDNVIDPPGGWQGATDWAGIRLTANAIASQVRTNCFAPEWVGHETHMVLAG